MKIPTCAIATQNFCMYYNCIFVYISLFKIFLVVLFPFSVTLSRCEFLFILTLISYATSLLSTRPSVSITTNSFKYPLVIFGSFTQYREELSQLKSLIMEHRRTCAEFNALPLPGQPNSSNSSATALVNAKDNKNNAQLFPTVPHRK